MRASRSGFAGRSTPLNGVLTGGEDCADILMLLANVRGGINSLMAEVLEDHIRLHLLSTAKSSTNPHELAEDMIELNCVPTSSKQSLPCGFSPV